MRVTIAPGAGAPEVLVQAAAVEYPPPQPIEIGRLVWDDANRAELAEHDVTAEEVEDLIALDEWVVDVHPAYPDQIRTIGRTGVGRWLTIAMAPTTDQAVWRPVTGWDATPREKSYYWDQ